MTPRVCPERHQPKKENNLMAINSNISIERQKTLNTSVQRFLQGKLTETRDLVFGTYGAVVPVEFSEWITEALKIYAPLTQFARTRFGSGSRGVKSSPRTDDTANGLWLVSPGTVVPEEDPTFGASTTIQPDLVSTGLIKYSNELRDASFFSVPQFLGSLAGSRYGRGIERIITRGKDFASVLTPGNPGIISLAQTAVTTSSLAAGISLDNLIDLYDSLDAAFLPRAVFQMTSKTRNSLIKNLDSTGRSLYVPAPNAGGFDTLLGAPVVINQSLDQLTVASGTPIVFGSLWDGLEIVGTEKVEIANLVERFADVNVSALLGYSAVGSAGLTAGALQKIVLASA
jgi:HK97 family phage major capsid protein